MGPKKDAVWDEFHEPYVPDGSKAAKAVCRNCSAVVSSHICSLYQTKRIIHIIRIIQPTFQKFIKHSSMERTHVRARRAKPKEGETKGQSNKITSSDQNKEVFAIPSKGKDLRLLDEYVCNHFFACNISQ